VKYKVGNIFAEIGGICLVFKQSGFQVIWVNEWDKKACEAYESNFPNHAPFCN